jgi:uncharacterized protein (DUF2237 family)
MQNPTDQAESSIPTETAREEPNLNRTFTVRRKAAKRSESWYVAPPPQTIVAPLSIPARKKPRLEEPPPTTTDEAATKTASPDISVGLPPPDTPPSTTLRRSSRRVIATRNQCIPVPPPTATTLRRSRRQTQLPARKKPRLEKPLTRITDEAARKTVSTNISVGLLHPASDNDDANTDPVTDTHDVLDCSIYLAIGRKNSWTEDEDIKLKKAVQLHGGKNWAAIAAIVPGRTQRTCHSRWHDVLDPSIALTAGSTGKWTEEEDLKLKNSVQMHGGKHWAAFAAMVPGRTKRQCNKRWYDALDPSIALTAGRTCTWTEDEDLKLKAAVQTHGGKNWNKIAAMVPGRTRCQCNKRWRNVLDPRIALTARRTCTWTEDESCKLKAAVKMHGGKNWNKIAAMVPGRTKRQCHDRWRYILDPGIALTAGSKGS